MIRALLAVPPPATSTPFPNIVHARFSIGICRVQCPSVPDQFFNVKFVQSLSHGSTLLADNH